MVKLLTIIKSFFDCKHSTKARIFLSFSLTTFLIATILSLFWYQRTIRYTTNTLLSNMEQSIKSSLAQMERSFEDVKQMHSTMIYETEGFAYITRDTVSAPNSVWFESYRSLYNNLRILGATLSRTVTGTGLYKADGSTCIYGTMGTRGSFWDMPESDSMRKKTGSDVLFFLDKPKGEIENEVKKYIYVGRTILEKGEEKAVIVSKLNENLLTDAFNDIADGFILVADSNHNIIYDSNPGNKEELKNTYINQLKTDTEPVSLNGNMVFYHTSSAMGINVVSCVSNNYIQQSTRDIRVQFIILIAMSVLSAGIISMLISDKITRRLKNLENNMIVAGDGTMTQMLPIPGEDEIGRLSDTFLEMICQIQNLMADIKEKEQQKRLMEIRVLRAQISPHFLYNSLNTINYLAIMQNSANIHALTSSLIDLLQASVEVDDILVPLKDEIHYVQSYLNIQHYRFPQQIRTEYLVEKEVEHLLVPKMILQPIVENALLHGFRNDQKALNLTIKAYMFSHYDKTLVITVTDNGVGMSDEKISSILKNTENNDKLRFSGIGISNVNARIKLQLGEKYGLSIYSRENIFTRVEIHLPAVKDAAHGEGGKLDD